MMQLTQGLTAKLAKLILTVCSQQEILDKVQETKTMYLDVFKKHKAELLT